MDFPQPLRTVEEPEAIIVKADEVDEAGADISTISPTDTTPSEFEARIETRRAHDAQAGGSPKILANAANAPPKPPTRPGLRRETSAPPPPQQPPPPAPVQRDDASNPTDSLSLQQLRQLVTDLPKFEPTAYAYTYNDTRSFPEEVDEWFQYTEEDRYMLRRGKQMFEDKWEEENATSLCHTDITSEWIEAKDAVRESFVIGALKALEDADSFVRITSLECLSYIVLGAWGLTAGMDSPDPDIEMKLPDVSTSQCQYSRCQCQFNWMRKGVTLLAKVDAIQILVNFLCRLSEVEHDIDASPVEPVTKNENIALTRLNHQLEINHTLTTLYVIIEVGRWEATEANDFNIRRRMVELEPDLLLVLTRMIAKLRWDESSQMPIHRLLLMQWKLILLLFGDTADLHTTKSKLLEPTEGQSKQDRNKVITTSPLDYHLFRQEITSKYPAYCPPQPLVPIELENNSILPPLSTHPSRHPSQENFQARSRPNADGTPGSIFNQPVHIATPAPSPPPSPAGPGGKGGKKQNYQTNQNFPFLYPPLDDTSNTVGGKGSAELQDKLVGKRWEGSDVPASIQEAGQLFASRMRMSRSIRQLWAVREEFIRHERGWNSTRHHQGIDESDELNDEAEEIKSPRQGPKSGERSVRDTEDEMAQQRLDAVENYYRNALPHLQSLIVVLWKVAFANVSNMVAQNGSNGLPNGFSFGEENAEAPNKRKQNSIPEIEDSEHRRGAGKGNVSDPELEDLNAARTREITFKAISGTLIMLLKWFKLSHILKFEYLAQLMLDANYLPLILKLFAHQDVDRSVEHKNDREDLNFFTFCRTVAEGSTHGQPRSGLSSSSSSDDEAAPPPIKKHRRSPSSHSPPPSPPPPPLRPEVDELGYPTTSLPTSPITTYNPRFFFTTITLLRILQKITKRKAHRALLLVQYKSSTILRRALKVPQPELRLYTLKLFKSQVPYCGRKWRQTNMRVITAIYLHCRPELRDEWLCGGDVDGVVEEAVPLEQAGRALVHWWHLREYRGVMEGAGTARGGEDGGKLEREKSNEEEMGFFERELEKMGWGTLGNGGDGVEEEGEGDGSGRIGTEWEGGPLAMEGWT